MRAEKIDLHAALRDVRAGRANWVSDARRLEEAKAILAYWPWDLLSVLDAAGLEGVWHVLWEPTTWHDVDSGEVVAYAREWLRERGRWPDVGTQRARFGRTRNHRLPGEVAGQEALEV